VPASGANVTFNAASANNQYAITLGANRTVGSVTFSSAAGTNAFTFSGNTLIINGTGITNNDTETETINSAVRINSAQTWNAASGGLTFNGTVRLAGNLTLSGTGGVSVNGLLTNWNASRTITNNNSGTVSFGSINLSEGNTARTLTIGGTGNTTVSGVIANGGTGAGGLTKTGSGTLTLSGANTYSGATSVNGGTLALGANNVLANSTAVSVAAGATLNLNNYSDTIGSLAGAGAVTLGSGTLTISPAAGSTTFSGSISGTGGLTKAGAGTLVLTGANTYSGATTVNAGTLSLGSSFTGSSLVLNGGTFLLSGASGTFNSLTVNTSSILDFGTAGASMLTILDSVTVASGATLTVQNWNDTVDYFYSLINPGVADPTIFNRIAFSGYPGVQPKWLPFDHEISPVPEPSAYGAALLGLSLLFAGWRQRHRRAAA